MSPLLSNFEDHDSSRPGLCGVDGATRIVPAQFYAFAIPSVQSVRPRPQLIEDASTRDSCTIMPVLQLCPWADPRLIEFSLKQNKKKKKKERKKTKKNQYNV
jgi:hypothetical protein